MFVSYAGVRRGAYLFFFMVIFSEMYLLNAMFLQINIITIIIKNQKNNHKISFWFFIEKS